MWIMYLIMAAIILVACLHMHWAIMLIAALIMLNGIILRVVHNGSKQEY